MTVGLDRKTALALRHVHFEDLGVLETTFETAGYEVSYHDVGADDPGKLDAAQPDLLVVLGGPIGVYDVEAYPFIEAELHLLERRLAAGRPTLGLCLGAQLMAAALGAPVRPMGHKEIGFSALTLSPAGAASPLRHLGGAPVLHWHGDAFGIPDGAQNLASTALCPTQAFSAGPNILALQFHPEIDAAGGIERWLVGHAAELSQAGIDPRILRDQAATFGPALRAAAEDMFSEWLGGLDHARS